VLAAAGRRRLAHRHLPAGAIAMPQTFNVGNRSLFVTATAWAFIVLARVGDRTAGLLLRLDWARRTFIGLLVVAIVANLLGLWLQQEVVQSVVDNTLARTTIPAQALGVFGGFVTAARVMALLMSLAACWLLVWIIRRLMSASVRQEFA
jgi:hypothetical protein